MFEFFIRNDLVSQNQSVCNKFDFNIHNLEILNIFKSKILKLIRPTAN